MGYLISLVILIFLIFSLPYKIPSEQNINQKKAQAWEHSIVLDTKIPSDSKLLKSLKLTQYSCKSIDLKDYVECSIKDYHQQSRPSPTPSRRSLMTRIINNGDSLKVYANPDGSAQLEVFDSTKNSHHHYSFTSTKSLLVFTKMYQNEIFHKVLPEFPPRPY